MVKRNREDASDSESDFDYENMANYEEPNEFEDSEEEQMDVDDANIKSNGGAFKAPTKDEVQSLRETGELFKSNFFKLQIDSLLEEIQQPVSQVETLTQALHALRNLIMETKPIGKSSDGKLSTSDAKKYLKKNNLSLSVSKELPEDVNWAVGYTVPDIVQVAGSWPLKTNVKRRSNRAKSWEVTLAILLPSHFIQEKDHQNDRWLFKQAFYMTVLADMLKKSKLDIQVDVTQANGSELEPVINITNKKGSKFIPSNTSINLVSALASPTPFKPLSKISPSRIGSKLSNAFMKPSLHTPHLTYLYNIAETVPAFRDAVKLLKVWANQRSLDWLLNGFNAEFVVSLLVDGDQDGKGRVGKGLSSYQLFKTVMDLLRKTDFTSVFMKSITTGGFSKEDHLDSAPLLFIDPTHTYNLMEGLLPEDARVIGFEAQLTLNALDDDNDRFEDTFMKDLRNPTARFDLIGKGKLPSKLVKKIAKGSNVRQNIAATLARALGERSKVINVKLDDDMISIGLILDSEVASKIVDHGPPAEDEEGCQVFKAFWGEISELRRFKDGKINESVVWQQSNGSKELVPIQIVKWILKRHFNIDHLSFIAEEFDGLLEVEAVDGVETFNDFGAPLQVYEDFQSMLRDMTTLPLEIMNVTPASAYLRHTSPYPQPTRQMNKFGVTPTSARYIPGADLVVQFESSGKWPDDLEAIQITKVAFLEALAAELMKGGQYMAQIVFDSPLPSDIADAVALEVINEQGFAWKLRIQHDRELTLIDRQLNDKVHTTNSQKEILKEARHRFLERFVNKPRHHQAIMALTHRFKAYAKTVRLVSRWINSHLLSPHISQEFIELIVASVFLDTGSYSVPCTPSLGFLRSVLLLSEWKYKQEPLLVPLYTASQIQEDHLDKKIVFPLKEKTEAEKAFEVLRRTDADIKNTAMFVATEHDISGGHYTHDRPNKVIASRLQSLAKATSSALLDDDEVDIMQLFKSPTEIYDFVINLKSWVNTRLYQSLAEDNFGDVDTSNDALVNYDPATMLVEYMERMYGDVVVFFHDTCGGRVIGAMFNPAYTTPRKWKVGLHYPTKSVDVGAPLSSENTKLTNILQSKDEVVIDKKFIIKEITTLGKDMIENVTTK